MAIDPSRLTQSELLQVVNATSLGEVIGERQLHCHRTRAGPRITSAKDGKAIDLLRYAAWLLLGERMRADCGITDATEFYRRKRDDRVGLNWRIPVVTGKRSVRHAVFDTNYWKSFIHARLNVQPPKPAEKPEEQRGLRCPKCGCGHFKVVYTRASWGARILRRRECRNCGRRISTTERAH